MASLADELADDFADSGDEGKQEIGATAPNGDGDGDVDLTESLESNGQSDNSALPSGVATFLKEVETLLEVVEIRSTDTTALRQSGDLTSNEGEYNVFQQCSQFSTKIQDHKVELFNFTRDHYQAHFPELAGLVDDAVRYGRTVAILKNTPLSDLKSVGNDRENDIGLSLDEILTKALHMNMNLVAATSKGKTLSSQDLRMALDGAMAIHKLDQAREHFEQYVMICLATFAPNLRVVVGDTCAAQLLNARGGLRGLAFTSPGNIPGIGHQHAGQSGMASNVNAHSKGFVFDTDFVQQYASDKHHAEQAMRVISGKLVLAARCDLNPTSANDRSGKTGQDFLALIQDKMGKRTEAPAAAKTRPLPVPDEKPSRKRGGRRARAAKASTSMTEFRGAQNRMVFGEEEKDVGYGESDESVGMGMIGQNDGRVRAMQIDQRTRAKLSKKNQGWGFEKGGSTSNAHGAGTASSLDFSTKTGMQLADPRAEQELLAPKTKNPDDNRYFGSGKFGAISTKRDAEGFKVPQAKKQKEN